jgi:hypothetical protein
MYKFFISNTAADAGIFFDNNFMTFIDKPVDTRRRYTYPVFIRFNFFGDANNNLYTSFLLSNLHFF